MSKRQDDLNYIRYVYAKYGKDDGTAMVRWGENGRISAETFMKTIREGIAIFRRNQEKERGAE